MDEVAKGARLLGVGLQRLDGEMGAVEASRHVHLENGRQSLRWCLFAYDREQRSGSSRGNRLLCLLCLLPLAAIPLLQTGHAGLADICVAEIEGIEIIGIDNGAELDLLVGGLEAVLGLRIAVGGSDEDGEGIRRAEVPERIVCDLHGGV